MGESSFAVPPTLVHKLRHQLGKEFYLFLHFVDREQSLIAEHEETGGRNPDRPLEPGVDGGVGGENRVRIDDLAELHRVSDLKRSRARGMKKEYPRENANRSCPD